MELQDLIQSVNIVDYISQFVDLEQRGDEWWGLSCFKSEKTPSFSVREDPPVFYDYSSGIGGNVFTFIRYYFKCSKQEAAKRLMEYAGIDSSKDIGTHRLAATAICKRFAKPKSNVKISKAEVLPDNYMDKYADDKDALAIWRNEGISDEVLERFKVRYDKFARRIVYPIRDIEGNIVNVGGRTIDPRWKEKGLRKYTYYASWGTLDTIYGLAENKETILAKREIILFEGCKSVLLASSWGVNQCAAILTSHLNPNQMRILARLGCRVVFALDNDVDITADHNIKKLAQYVNVEYIHDAHNVLEAKDAPVDKGFEVFSDLYCQKMKL